LGGDMRLNRMAISAAAVMALSIGTSSAFADSRDQGRNGRDGRDGRAQTRSEGVRPPERGAPRVERAVPREAPRASEQPNVDRRNFDGRNFDRRNFERRDFERRDFERRDFERRDFDRRYYAPRFFVPRPYRPGLSLGFGIFFGDLFPYRYAYPAYGYPAGVAYGGISFGITPADAAIYVDGDYAGIVSSFSGVSQPLTLPAGSHRIELQAPGFVPTVFDVNVIGGQVIPYQGSLQPAY
jgi:hypothetical protein